MKSPTLRSLPIASLLSAAAPARLLLPTTVSPVVVDAVSVATTRANQVIKTDHYVLTNMLYDKGTTMTYDPDKVNDVGAAFEVNYVDPGGSGMDAYVSGTVGGKKSGGQWRPGDYNLTGMPVLVGDLEYDFRIRWSVSQEHATDPDDKWWATINVIFDSGGEFDEPNSQERWFDIVIELDRYEQDDLDDKSKDSYDTYWWFARNGDGSLRPFVLHIDGETYEWGVRYKFFQNQGWKDNKVHVKFIPVNNDDVAPYVDHPLKVFTDAATEYLEYVDLPPEERTLAEMRVSNSSLWVKAISAGYETYTGSSILRQDELRTITDDEPPASPSGLVAIRTDEAVTLDWSDLVVDEPSLHGYEVWRSDDGGSTFDRIAKDVYESSYVDDDASGFVSYQYYVVALDRSYNVSPPSDVVVVEPTYFRRTYHVAKDTYAKMSDPSTNYGTSSTLAVREDGSSVYSRVAYLQFDVTGITRTVHNATLNVFSITEEDEVVVLAVSDSAWTETGLTWDNRPATGMVVGTGRPVASMHWFPVDVTSYITGNGVYSIALDELGNTLGKLGCKENGFPAYADVIEGPYVEPTSFPTTAPTTIPTGVPTDAPTVVPTSVPTPEYATTIVPVSEDVYAKQSSPQSNFGSDTDLEVRSDGPISNWSRVSYLKFLVSGITRHVQSVKLHLYSKTETDDVNVHAVDDTTWTESGLTWENRPAVGGVVGVGRPSATYGWFAIDLSSGYVAGDGVYAVALDERGDSVGKLGSREGGFGPFLEIVTGPFPPPTGEPTSVPSIPPTLLPTIAPTASPTPLLTTSVFVVSEDTFAKQPSPTSNFESRNSLEVRQEGASNWSRVAYLKFHATGIARAVRTATLRVYAATDVSVVNALSVSDSTWAEHGLTWDNRPAVGVAIGNSGGATEQYNWFEIDVTGYVTENGTYSIALDEQGNTFSALGSREGGYGSYLEVTSGPPADVDVDRRRRQMLRG